MLVRTFLILTILTFSQNVCAQESINKGSIWLGGTTGFSTISSKNASGSTISLKPNAKYFIKSGLFVGTNVDWERRKDGGNTSTITSLGSQFGLAFERQDALSIPYVAIGLGYLNSRQDDNIAILSRNGFELAFIGGFNILIKESFGILVEASYKIQSYSEGQNFNVFGIGIGINGILSK